MKFDNDDFVLEPPVIIMEVWHSWNFTEVKIQSNNSLCLIYMWKLQINYFIIMFEPLFSYFNYLGFLGTIYLF